ncbi:cell division protein ZipA C-terminal FtsZ-binding domain-containing protein [Amphritea sp. HPY]|uniref:cell division protein ZipA C-terminal FtsZ-binding domain-containing protein n=1 Tax=Amphritea sp. HPY TaxID=3421652 RepID=UPI003D7E36F5
MELSLREWLIIGGGIVVALIVLDGWRRMRGNRNTLKMGIDTSLTDTSLSDEDEENYNPELPGGGFRVLDAEGKVVTKPAENPALQLNTFVDVPVNSSLDSSAGSLGQTSSQPGSNTAFSAERDPLFEPLDDFNSLSEGVSAVRVVKSEDKAEPEFNSADVVDPVVTESGAAEPNDEIPIVSDTYVTDLGPATDQYEQPGFDPDPLLETLNDELTTQVSDEAHQTYSTDQEIASAEDKADTQQPEYKVEPEPEFESELESEPEPEFKEQAEEEQLCFDAYSEPEAEPKPEPDTAPEPEPDIVRPQFTASRTQSADEDDLIASLPEGFSFEPQPPAGQRVEAEAYSEDELDLTRPVSELMRRTQVDENSPQQESMELVETPEPEAESALAPLLNEEPVTTEADSLYTDDLSDNSDIDPFVDGKSLQTLPEADKVLVISVVAPEAAPDFNGRSLLQIVLACGMRYGDMKIFHRYEDGIDKGAIQFSMTNALEPGYFELDTMDQLETRGVTFFMSMEEPRDVMNAYECMLATAEAVAKNLRGELMDENRSTMRSQTKEHYRERIRKFEMRKLKQPV